MKTIVNLVFIGIATVIATFSCKKKTTCGDTMISEKNETESHQFAKNCMDCHLSGKSGEGCFEVAGSVADSTGIQPKPNVTINLFSQPNGGGTLVATISVDANGNFYTTEQVNFGTGLFPSIKNSNGVTKFMSSSTITGQCNSCHNVSTASIWIP